MTNNKLNSLILGFLVSLKLIQPALAEIEKPRGVIRVATFNVALFGSRGGQIADRLERGKNPRVRAITDVLIHANADIVLVNELDYDHEGRAANALATILNERMPDKEPYLAYPFPTNTGLSTGLDLIGSGTTNGPNNAYGFGRFPGQYGFALLSRFPMRNSRSFQHFLWKNMPGALLPDAQPGSGDKAFYRQEILDIFRLSSKNHVDATVDVPGLGPIHLLLSHPTPPVFDGPEYRNGKRNHDEIRLLVDYIRGQDYLVDDAGRRGGLSETDLFIVLGDLNADPLAGESYPGAIEQLLRLHQVQDPEPQGAKGTQTASFGQRLRVDYVLPCDNLRIHDSGVVWYPDTSEFVRLNNASDHRLVWVDLEVAR